MRASERVILSIVSVACLCSLAYATDFQFNAVSGDWDTPENWYPPGKPVDGDTATIPTGRTCYVALADQAATRVTVASGATLRVDNKRLAVNPSGGTGLTVNGTVVFANSAVLLPASDTVIDGTGQLVTASGGTASVGWLLEDATIWLTINSGVMVKGSFKFYCRVHNDGILAVDNPEHDMEIGECDAPYNHIAINGSGTYRASAGTMRFGDCAIGVPQESARLVVNGGTMKFCKFYTPWLVPWSALVTAGTLVFDDDFEGYGSLDYSGGKIKVKSDTWVRFYTPS